MESIPFTADLLGLHELDPRRYPALIESAADQSTLGRYDILFAFPEESLFLTADGQLLGRPDRYQGRFLDAFDTWWAEERIPRKPLDGLPFSGGWFVLLGYELANEIEPRLALRPDLRQPVAVALRIPVAIIRDRSRETAWIVAEHGHQERVEGVRADLERLTSHITPTTDSLVDAVRADAPEEFLAAVAKAQSYIAAGDIYQANLSRQWTARLRYSASPTDIYRRLRETNPAPFAGIAELPGMTVISSSPERLLRTDGRVIETRPIAGTRPRGPSDDDADRREELQSNPKERAEHVMLIDLERNDLGRICKPGTVQVDEFMVIETYAHVHHIVSNVRGELREDTTPGSIIRAVFPGGSITGCPKVRCMEIIDELENRPRGVYTGAMGYINRDGSADLNILIRSIAVTGREVSVATGSGIVADSDPQLELEETRAKARGLLMALDLSAG
ncbi:MAG: aminodeoxychorismate synthase component I, partial [Gammaproteobacteria bacterium]|nr:aminodeoxychorismate synthase component I [Gammaproteobacteria bacterium]